MNSYERVMRRLNGEAVDKVPNLNIIMAFAAKNIGVPYSKYVTDFQYLVEANIKCCEQFGIDAVCAISDPVREAHSFGAKITIPVDGVPFCTEPLIKDYSSLQKIKAKSPYDDIRTLDRIKAIELFNKQVKNKYPIIGWVEGALAEAADLRDISQIMMDLILDPGPVMELFEIIYQQQLEFTKSQIEAGADIIGVGDAAASLVGPELYEKYVLPYEKRIVDDIHRLGAKAKLHICGNTEAILHLIKKVDADIVDVDWKVDFKKAIDAFKDSKSAACGNMDPVSVFLFGDCDTVRNSVQRCLDVADTKTLIAGGCEIPRDTPYENMLAMNELLCNHFRG